VVRRLRVRHVVHVEVIRLGVGSDGPHSVHLDAAMGCLQGWFYRGRAA
jgi:hypothetical protein